MSKQIIIDTVRLLIFVILTLNSTLVLSQTGPIKIFRNIDDFAYVQNNDSTKLKYYEKLKYMSLAEDGRINISFGGEIREQYQFFNNENFGDLPPNVEPDNNGHLWHRVMAHAHLRLGDQWRVFGQFNSTFAFGKSFLTPQIDENRLSLHQAFVRWQPNKGRGFFTQIGRQEFGIGSEYIIAMREGPNTRLTFDAALVGVEREKHKLYSFVATPVVSQVGVFDDTHISEYIWTLYWVNQLKKLQLDLYYFGFYGEENRYNYAEGIEQRQSLGIRLYNLPQNPFMYDAIAVYQFGQFEELSISAYNLMVISGYRFKKGKQTWIPGLTLNLSSGDQSPNDDRLNTYNMLYSRPTFGLSAPIGASNIINIKPTLEYDPQPNIRIIMSGYFMYRHSINDGTYTPGRVQTRPLPFQLFQSSEKEIGKQMSLEIWYLKNANWSFFADASYFTPGNYVKETGQGRPITYLSAKASFKF
ncbi:Alginate export [Marivirga sericea]|uniref:Alginate export n=1 Tax=Marivirga sericea TaxID=1028 RepID=A0A1X7L0B6_9BACT|nr:alginate export family protein [Marivirga sericea]SMG47067.1 Alginate export [Marivirga sericea]